VTAISTTPSPGGPLGSTTVQDTASLSGGSSPTGTITFKLYGPSATASCSGTPLSDQTVSVAGNGSYATPAGVLLGQAGTYWWTASYGGDAGNTAAASGCGTEQVTISALAVTALTTTPSPGGPVGSTTVQDTAALSGGSAPTGTIEFKLYGPSATASCSGTPLSDQTVAVSGNGSYTTPAGVLLGQAGTYWWTASYGGDVGNAPAASGCGAEQVVISSKVTLGIGLAAGQGGPVGTTVQAFAALAAGDNPTGTITFNLYGPTATASCTGTPVDTETVAVTGNGSYTTPVGATPSQVGTYWWTASYSGDANNNPAVTVCGQLDQSVTITQTTTTTVTSSADPSVAGQAVTFTATVSAVPDGGTVAFYQNGTPITACAAQQVDTSTGTATCQVTFDSAGTYVITSIYSGYSVFGISVGDAVQTVNP
jgi:hypothetical protein